jgi:hypothetical protein
MTEELHRAVGRMEGKIDGIVEMLTARNARDERVDKRVSAVEKKQAQGQDQCAGIGRDTRYRCLRRSAWLMLPMRPRYAAREQGREP